METVGVYLKKERESRNISLREVSRLTKISELYLDCIEKDDYDKIPKGPYVKGYISSYSRLIGGDVDEALKLYDSLNEKINPTEIIQPEPPKEKGWRSSIGASFTSIVASLNREKNNGQDHRVENYEASRFETPPASPAGKRKSAGNAVAPIIAPENTSSRTVIPPVRRAFTAFKNIVSSLIASSSKVRATIPTPAMGFSSLKTAGNWLKTAVAAGTGIIVSFFKTLFLFFRNAVSAVRTNRWLANRQTGLVACGVTLLGAGILVLAGFGFYHLFIFDKPVPIAAEVQNETGKITSAPVDTGVDKKRSSSLSAKTGTQPSQAKTNSLKSGDTSAPVSETKKPVSPSPSSMANTTSSPPPVDKKSRQPSAQGGTTPDPAPKSTAADANLRVLKASICSEIKDRMPAGVNSTFPASVQRIYVWNQIVAKQYPTKIRHIYSFQDQIISDVTLNVRSPSWRTWSFKSISNDRYRGRWYVDIATLEGKVLRRLYFEVY